MEKAMERQRVLLQHLQPWSSSEASLSVSSSNPIPLHGFDFYSSLSHFRSLIALYSLLGI